MRFWGMFRFTLGETLRKGTLIFYFAVATVIILFFALGMSISPNDPNVVMIFGKPMYVKATPEFNIIEFMLLSLHQQSVGAIILFGIFGVAGLIPSMLEKGTIDLFLSKPLSRGELLISRALGATAGITINIIYFIFGMWLVFGLKVGVWHTGFLESSLFVAYAYACFFSLVTFIGLVTRSTGFTIMLAFIFYIISWGLEIRELGLYFLWDNIIYHRVLDVLYYLTPQLNAMLTNASRLVGRSPIAPGPSTFTWMPFAYSLFSTVFLYGLSVWYFSRQDY